MLRVKACLKAFNGKQLTAVASAALLLLPAITASAQHSANIYRLLNEERDGFKIWIVDGGYVRAYIDSEFLYGGNQERYTYNPEHEIWIDNQISCEEYSYTLAHEMLEVRLMADSGMTYGDAHDSALMLEERMRVRDRAIAVGHEDTLMPVPPVDYDSLKEIASLPTLIKLRDIYRQYVRTINGYQIWIVDGAAVRRDIFPDFGLSGDGLCYYFIPRNEIWLDNATGCEEMEFSIATELQMCAMMAKGSEYYPAYTEAIREVNRTRRDRYAHAEKHPALRIAGELHREKGTGRGGL